MARRQEQVAIGCAASFSVGDLLIEIAVLGLIQMPGRYFIGTSSRYACLITHRGNPI